MSKISAIKLQLAKILASFSSLNTDKGVLEWPDEKEIEVGLEVFVEDAEGNYIPAEDGEYVANDIVVTIEGGKVVSIVLPEPTVEPKAEVELEEEPIVEEPVVDPLAEIKDEIKEIASIVASLVDKVASLEAETATTRETLEKMSKMSVAMSSVEIEKTPVSKTGNPKLDARLKEMFK